MPAKTRLPHLPLQFGRILQVNGVDVGSISIYPVYPKGLITNTEFMPAKTRLPHLPQRFGRVFQVNGVDVGSISIYRVYPKG